jgi:hypothetical protein
MGRYTSVASVGTFCFSAVVHGITWKEMWRIFGIKNLCAPDDYSTKTQCIRTVPTQLMSWRWPSLNTSRMWTMLYWTWSSRTQFSVSINVWRLGGGTLWTLLVTFCIVIIRYTETFWQPCNTV